MWTLRRNRLIVACAGLLLLALCAGEASAKKVKIPLDELPPPQPSAPESLAYYVDELPYRIAPGDLLTVDFGVALDGKAIRDEGVLVRPDGMITLNPIGDVRAAGLTPGELDSAFARFAAEGVQLVQASGDNLMFIQAARIAGLALEDFVALLGDAGVAAVAYPPADLEQEAEAAL